MLVRGNVHQRVCTDQELLKSREQLFEELDVMEKEHQRLHEMVDDGEDQIRVLTRKLAHSSSLVDSAEISLAAQTLAGTNHGI